MYEHADQSWRQQPHFLSDAVAEAIGRRVAEYAAKTGIPALEVVFHGGEPLLAGAARLAALADLIRSAVGPPTSCDFSLQTNGVLLDETSVSQLAHAGVAISLSLDGPASLNDLHRRTKQGESSHAATERSVQLLLDRPEVFSGVLSVIDPECDPQELLQYFSDLGVPSLDLLLPDANHIRQPLGRAEDPELYARWLTAAFDVWFDHYAHLPVRTFDALLGAVCGQPSPTDAFGLGDVNLLTIETDGSYHDLDVLKITYDGASALHLNVIEDDFASALTTPTITRHRRLLTMEGLSSTCRACPEVEVCGGGAVPHRYADDGFAHASVYCHELLTLIRHVRRRLQETVAADAAPDVSSDLRAPGHDLMAFDLAATATPILTSILDRWSAEAVATWAGLRTDPVLAAAAAAVADHPWVATTPSSVCLLRIAQADRKTQPLRALDGRTVSVDKAMVAAITDLARLVPQKRPFLHRDDPLLRAPFGPPISFLDVNQAEAQEASTSAATALRLIEEYDPHLMHELGMLCTDIQFIVDTDADPDKTVSFSDDAVPGALYVAPTTARGPISGLDLADSIIHEHRHQKLYILQRDAPLLRADFPLVPSPWRSELRPPSGVLHAVFVFTELLCFWRWAASTQPDQTRPRAEVELISGRLLEGVAVLSNVALTDTGRRLVAALGQRVQLW